VHDNIRYFVVNETLCNNAGMLLSSKCQ